jgi:raffinose/stachyose/melibiose transport system substrate-binding protein
MKKRFSALLMLILTLSLVFTSCIGSVKPGDAPADSEGDSGEPIVLSFLNKYPEDEYRPHFERVIKEFQDIHRNVTINMESVSDHAIKDKLSIIAGSDLPDIFFTWPGEYQRKFDRAGITLDLTPYLDADPEWRDSFIPALLDTGAYQGKNYSIPFRFSIMFVLYNKDMFAQYGLEEPEDYSEFLDICETLKENGEIPLLFGNSGEWYGSWYAGTYNQLCVPYDVKLKDYDPASGEFAHAGYVNALQYIKDLQDKGYFSPNVLSVDYYQAREQFCAGMGGMFLDATSQFSIFEEDAAMDWGFFKFPGIPNEDGSPSHITGGAEAYCISASCNNPDMAVEFLKFLTSFEQAYAQTKDVGLPNPLINGIDEGNGSAKLIEATKLLGDYEGIAAWLDTDVDAKVADAYMAGISEMLGGNKTPAQVIEDVKRAADEVRNSQ